MIFRLAMVCALVGAVEAQTWQPLPAAPTETRKNDVCFVDAQTGWVVNGRGKIYKTSDSGTTWQVQADIFSTHFRSVAFFDSLHGFAGNVGQGEFNTTNATVLYETLDGGETWQGRDDLSGPAGKGICGMQVVNDSMVVAVGRVRGPSYFYRSLDRGKTWSVVNLERISAGLIDVHFFNADTGFVVGLSNTNHDQSSGIILATTDGGKTWKLRFTSSRKGEWCWKLDFPSRRVGYASLQRNSLAPIYILKTEDSGETWQEKLFSESHYFVQGIGFINENQGWIGGTSRFPTYTTSDGGETWKSAEFGSRINRFQFLNDSLGFAVGRSVYKFALQTPTAVEREDQELPDGFTLAQNYPNPFNPSTTIAFSLPEQASVQLEIYNMRGQRIRILRHEMMPAGTHQILWDGMDDAERNVSSGIYIYRLRAGDKNASRKMILIE